MELRPTEARQRALTWTSPRGTMTTKERKDWQAAMEAIGKRMVEVVQTPAEKHEKVLAEVKELLVKEVTGLKKEIGEIKTELQNNIKELTEVEQKSRETDQVIQILVTDTKKNEMMTEFKSMQT